MGFLSAFVVLFVLTIVSIGWGQWIWARVFQLSRAQVVPIDLSYYGLIGLFGLGMLGVLLNFLLPLTPVIQWFCTTVGLGLFVRAVTKKQINTPNNTRLEWLQLSLCLAIFSWWSTKLGWGYDSGLYTLQSIAWMTQEPVPVGIANLHGRLAFNSIWLSALSIFDWGGIEASAKFVANGLLASFFFSLLIGFLVGSKHCRRLGGEMLFLNILLLASVFFLFWHGPNIDTDYPVAVLVILVYVNFLTAEQPGLSEHDVLKRLLLIWLLGGFAVLCKISAAPVLILPVIETFLALKRGHDLRRCLVGPVLVLIMATAWTVRSFLLSGCLAYPIVPGCSDSVAWGAGTDLALSYSDAIIGWAQSRSLSPGQGWGWVSEWVVIHQPFLIDYGYLVQALIAAILVLMVFSILRRMPTPRAPRGFPNGRYPIAMAVTILSLGFWFVTAPEPRFAMGSIIVFTSLSIAGVIVLLKIAAALENSPLSRQYWLFSLPAALLIALVRYETPFFTAAPSGASLNAAVIHVRDGNEIRMPLEGDQCWQISIPCTPYLSPETRYSTDGWYPVFTRERVD